MPDKKRSHIEEKTPLIEEMKIALQTAQALSETETPQQQTYKCNICRKEFVNNGNTSNMGMDYLWKL
jgi:hypothetical protein